MNISSVMPKQITLAFFQMAVPNKHSGCFWISPELHQQESVFPELRDRGEEKKKIKLVQAVTPISQVKGVISTTRNERMLNFFQNPASFMLITQLNTHLLLIILSFLKNPPWAPHSLL